MSSKDSYAPIEDYGIIGDLHTVALVGNDGSIDFLCFPSFDSPSVFAALLDRRKGGFFRICPEIEDATRKQIYLLNTNILMSRFLHDDGVAELVDFMPLDDTGSAHTLVRQIRVVRGEMQFRMTCAPRFDYARAEHDVERDHAGNVVFRSRGRDHTALRLRHSVNVEMRDGDAIARFGLRAGETAEFVLEAASLVDDGAPVTESTRDAVEDQFRATRNFWRRWVGRCRYDGRWRDTVLRSALVLKLLSSARYGSIVAAPTFGLPEKIGGPRNWDYRYTWIRDAAFAFYGLTRLGFVEEAEAFMGWITKYCRGESTTAGPLQVLYGIDGRRDVAETTLDHLEGYRGSAPVRIGNAARKQLQLDIYGELMDSIYLYDKHGELISYDLWANLVPMIDWLCAHWQQPDRSIWEVRNAPEEFLYSRLMCWLAIDRALRLAHSRSFPAPRERWLLTRDEIYRDIFE
ncbi:MAG: glycoside hydrolase family 15 protein, partial [Acidobacteriota bacterium]